MTRYIFVTGGVASSLGKGIVAASLAALLQKHGFQVRVRKLDPYLNVDPGTMSPYQHGEVYVTDDGTEADLDLGHYERFTGVPARRNDSITTGKIYAQVIAKERQGAYQGATIQVVPHIIDEIKQFITADTQDTDFIIAEIGGTVGDIESLPFLETIRQLRNDLGTHRTVFIHLTLIPYIAAAGEIKTKPSQHSVKELLRSGIQADILVCRTEHPLADDTKQKLGLFCNIPAHRVIESRDLQTIYEAPILFHAQGLDQEIFRYFGQETSQSVDLSIWSQIVQGILTPQETVTIGIVGKYVRLLDSYKSIAEALIHAGIANNLKVHFSWLDPEDPDLLQKLKVVDGILLPSGVGTRGIRGKLQAIQFARKHKIPFFGLCLGMQLCMLEACHQLGTLPDAPPTTEEGSPESITDLMTQWLDHGTLLTRDPETDPKDTLRLGSYPCTLITGSHAARIYGTSQTHERHRHHYTTNIVDHNILEKTGLYIAGLSSDGALPEIIERRDHPWFIAVQFHPEFKSRPFKAHPLFIAFIQATHTHQKGTLS